MLLEDLSAYHGAKYDDCILRKGKEVRGERSGEMRIDWLRNVFLP